MGAFAVTYSATDEMSGVTRVVFLASPEDFTKVADMAAGVIAAAEGQPSASAVFVITPKVSGILDTAYLTGSAMFSLLKTDVVAFRDDSDAAKMTMIRITPQ